MKVLAEQIANRLRPRGARAALLQFAGLSAISFAFGMWLLPVGIGVGGASLLVLAWLSE